MSNVINCDDRRFEIILSYIKRLTNYSIGKYYDKSCINTFLDKVVGFYNIEEYLSVEHFMGIPDIFFNSEINTEADLNNIISSNPELKNLLVFYGINKVFLENRDSRVDTTLKTLISNYFASKGNELREEIFGNRKFMVNSKFNPIVGNIINELAIILGEDTLAMTLKKGSKYLMNQIYAKSLKKGLDANIIRELINIYFKCEKIDKLTIQCDKELKLINEKINPIICTIQKYDEKYRLALLKYVENSNFDLQPLKNDKLIDFDSEEIELINKYIIEFNKLYSENNNNKSFDANNFSFIDKVKYVVDKHMEEYAYNNDLFDNDWNKLNRIIIYDLLPRCIRNTNVVVNLEQLVKLGTYTMNNTTYSLAGSYRTKLLQKKINKSIKSA